HHWQPTAVLLALRVTWLSLPVSAGPAIAHALDGTSTAVAVVVSALAWAIWAGGVVAVLVPRTLRLTALPLLGPPTPAPPLCPAPAGRRLGAPARRRRRSRRSRRAGHHRGHHRHHPVRTDRV